MFNNAAKSLCRVCRGKFSATKEEFLSNLDDLASQAIRAMVQGLFDLRKFNYCHMDIKTSNLLYREVRTCVKRAASENYTLR